MKTTDGKDTTKYGQLTLWTRPLRMKRYGMIIVRKKRDPKPPGDKPKR